MANIRPADRGDLRTVADIYAHYVHHSVATFEIEPPPAREWQARFDWCAGRGLPFLVSEEGGEVAGYAYCSSWMSRLAYARTIQDSIYLAPWATGLGLGRPLLEELLRGSARADAKEMLAVIADTGDPASLALHKRCGFTEAGRLTAVGFKHDRWLDTVILQRSLGGC
jgi:L-amino acid N-acyltransferase YncA